MGAEPLELALPKRFELVRHLGTGGMGAVYEALDRERGARVALKTLWSSRPEALLHLKNEFRALQDVRHPNLVHLLELVEDAGRFFVVMELVEGDSFLTICRPGVQSLSLTGLSETREVQRGRAVPGEAAALPDSAHGASGKLDEPSLRRAVVQLVEGLCALHDRGKLHRDVKPANVLITREGRVVLVDFGLAHDLSTTAWPGGGTRAFMAPEQAAGQVLSAAADWFSVGVMLYLALTGRLPFSGPEQQRKKLLGTQQLPPMPADVPRDLGALTLELLDADPQRRPGGRELLQRLGVAERAEKSLISVPFLGRAAELARLTLALERAQSQAVVTLVIGDSGLGKSALVREWLERTAPTTPELLVLRGRCYERELLPYKAFDGIVDALSQFLLTAGDERSRALLPADAWILARVFPVLGRLAHAFEPPNLEVTEPQELRDRAFLALRELLAKLSQQRQVVLFIDDLQWADADSYLLLSELLRQPRAPQLLLVATTRPLASSGPLREVLDRLGPCEELALLPLAAEEARALAASVLGQGQPALIEAVARETAGHPLFLRALAEHARHRGGFEQGTVRLDDAILSHIERVEPAARRLLEVIALAGGPVASEIARSAAALDPNSYTACLASLRVLRLVRTSLSGGREPVEPYHDRIRESLLGRLAQPARRGHHHRLADAMLAAADLVDPQALVRHLEGAERGREAAQQAELGARQAERALAFDQAAELFGIALRLSERSEHDRLRVALAEALTNAGRAREAAEAYLKAAEDSPPEARLAYRRRAADHLLRSGHLEQGTAVLADVLHDSRDVLLSQWRSLLSTLWQRFRLKRRGLGWSPEGAGSTDQRLLARIDAYHAVGVSLALIDPVRGSAFQARALRLALTAGEPLRLAPVLLMEAGYEASGGAQGLSQARRLHHEALEIAELTGDPYIAASCRLMQGFIEYHAAEFGAAAATLTEMEERFKQLPGSYFEQAFCHCFRLICLRNQGRYAELQRGFSGWVRGAARRGDRFTEASLRFNLNGVWLARDEPEEALRDLKRVTWIPPEGGYHVQHWYEQQALNEIDLYTGRARSGLLRMRGEMRALSRSFILRIRLHRAAARWQLARLMLAAVAERHAPRSTLREVQRLEQQLLAEQLGCATSWALLVRAGRQQLLQQPEQAVAALQSARERAQAHQLLQCQHAASYQLGRLLGGSRGRELQGEAAAWVETEGIQDGPRFLGVFCPGFA